MLKMIIIIGNASYGWYIFQSADKRNRVVRRLWLKWKHFASLVKQSNLIYDFLRQSSNDTACGRPRRTRNSGYLVITRYAIWSQQGPKNHSRLRLWSMEYRNWKGNGNRHRNGNGLDMIVRRREPLAYAAVWDSDGRGPPRRDRPAEPVQDQASLCGAECRWQLDKVSSSTGSRSRSWNWSWSWGWRWRTELRTAVSRSQLPFRN